MIQRIAAITATLTALAMLALPQTSQANSLVPAASVNCLPASTHGLNFPKTWAACHAQFDRQLPVTLSRNDEVAAFAAVFANRYAPYGGDYTSDKYAALLTSPSIACDAYAALTYYFAHQVAPKIVFTIAGWNGGAVGNHAQIFTSDLTVDPTIGAVAAGSFWDVYAGKPSAWLVSFRVRHDLDTFDATVTTALFGGLYRQPDLIYLVHHPDWTGRMPNVGG
jgi:hypothetical protein